MTFTMDGLRRKILVQLLLFATVLKICTAGVSPVHDLKDKMTSNVPKESFLVNTPQKMLKQLDNSILKVTKNVTQSQQMEENLYQISKDLVSAILSKLEIQDKITRITREALEAPGKNKGISAIETRRILDYISRTISGHILKITRTSTEPELHRLVFGLSQIAAEVSIVSALKDITYTTSLSKKQAVDLTLRKKRSIGKQTQNNVMATLKTLVTKAPKVTPSVYNIILNSTPPAYKVLVPPKPAASAEKLSPFSVISRNDRKIVQIVKGKLTVPDNKGFLNQTVLDMENSNPNMNETVGMILDKKINNTQYVTVDSQSELQENQINLLDDWSEFSQKASIHPDVPEIEIDELEPDIEQKTDKKSKQKLEQKAKKAILYAGDIAYLTAASVVALRRALTASIEVRMSVKYAKNGMANHQELMMNLAKTAAQQAGKEAKNAMAKSLACEKVMKLALRYSSQAHEATLNHVASRIVMDSLPLATLAKSMAFVASDIAINSLYQATELKPPS